MAEARKSTAGRKSDVKGLTRRRSNDEAAPALDAAGEEVVCELLSDVWDRTVEAITVAAVDKLTPAFTAEYMCRSLFTVLAWGDLAHDEVPSGEAFLKPPAEPDPGEADRWARGALPSKATVKALDLPLSPPPSAHPGSQPSSARSTMSQRGKRRKPPPSAAGSRKGEPQPEPIMFNISEEDKRTDLMVPEGYKWPDKAKSREPSVDDEASVLEARRLADEDELFKKKIHAIKSKGKKWTLTPDGAILEIVPPGKAESALSPHYAVRGVQRQPLAPSPAKSPPPKHSTKKKKGRDSEAKAPSAADARRDAAEAAFRRYFKVSPLEQPSMVAGEGGFGCAAGVTVKQGARSLAGAPMLEDPDHRSRASYESSRSGGASFASTLESADEAASPTRGLADRLARGSRSEAELPSPALPGPESVDPFAGAHPLAYSRSSPALGTPQDVEDENVRLTHASDWGAVGPLRDPFVGRRHTRQSSRQRARTFEHGAAKARAARVRVAAAPPTRPLLSYAVPPPGVSETALHVFEVDAHSYHSASSMSLTLPKINARPL